MPNTPWFKLASRIVCLVVLASAALWLNVSPRAESSFECVLSANTKNGDMTKVSCGTSEGDAYWACSSGSCNSDPQMDTAASQACDRARANGCPEIVYYLN
jgi:hypothetical protein